MITYSDDYFVIQNKLTKQLWKGHMWITPQDRLDVYACSLDPDSPEEDYADSSVHALNHPDDSEMTYIVIETRIIL